MAHRFTREVFGRLAGGNWNIAWARFGKIAEWNYVGVMRKFLAFSYTLVGRTEKENQWNSLIRTDEKGSQFYTQKTMASTPQYLWELFPRRCQSRLPSDGTDRDSNSAPLPRRPVCYPLHRVVIWQLNFFCFLINKYFFTMDTSTFRTHFCFAFSNLKPQFLRCLLSDSMKFNWFRKLYYSEVSYYDFKVIS